MEDFMNSSEYSLVKTYTDFDLSNLRSSVTPVPFVKELNTCFRIVPSEARCQNRSTCSFAREEMRKSMAIQHQRAVSFYPFRDDRDFLWEGRGRLHCYGCDFSV